MEFDLNKKNTVNFEGIKFNWGMECGNLAKVVALDFSTYHLWIRADPESNYRTWFYFQIQGVQAGTTLKFIIMNMSNQVKLFKQGHRPVFKIENQPWQPIKIPIQQNGIVKGQQGYQLTFKHFFCRHCLHSFAFSYPWEVSENDKFIRSMVQKYTGGGLNASYQELCKSTHNRSVNLLTLTKKMENKGLKQIKIVKCNNFKTCISSEKKGIFISARVHPGQIASSYILNGFLKYLFYNYTEAHLLLSKFIFYIVPIINPDGVAEGNFRTDSQGKNLNRYYANPCPIKQPQIAGIKNFLIQMIKNKHIEFCLDLHAHANKQGAFIYGNSIPNLKEQVDVCAFAKIMTYNCTFFDYDGCNFSEKNMISKDKNDGISKQGASRVAIYKDTGLATCWTLECNYTSCKFMNILEQPIKQLCNKSVSNAIITSLLRPDIKEDSIFFGLEDFQSIGRSIAESICDFYRLRSPNRLYASKLKNHENFLLNTAIEALRMIPFRFDHQCRKLLVNLNNGMIFQQTLHRIKQLLGLEVIMKINHTKSIKDNKNAHQRVNQMRKVSNRIIKSNKEIISKSQYKNVRTKLLSKNKQQFNYKNKYQF